MTKAALRTRLLAGTAIYALSTAAVLAAAAPNIHIALLRNGPVHFRSLGTKTKIRDMMGHHKTHCYTGSCETWSISGTITETAFYHNPTLLWSQTWYATSAGKCVQPKKEKYYGKGTKNISKVKGGSTQGENPCGTGIFTYYGPVYDLESKTAPSDQINGEIYARKFKVESSTYYDLDLITYTDLTIKH